MDFGGPPAALSLWHYAFSGDFDKLSSLISHSATAIDILDDENRTPLHLAAAGGSTSCITYLLDKGANPNAKDNTGIVKREKGFYLFILLLLFYELNISLSYLLLTMYIQRQNTTPKCLF